MKVFRLGEEGAPGNRSLKTVTNSSFEAALVQYEERMLGCQLGADSHHAFNYA